MKTTVVLMMPPYFGTKIVMILSMYQDEDRLRDESDESIHYHHNLEKLDLQTSLSSCCNPIKDSQTVAFGD